MKRIILIAILFQFTLSFSQSRGVVSPRSGRMEIPKFESVKIAGIFEYDTKKVLKKLKLKQKDSIAKSVKEHVTLYNSQIKIIEASNKDLFEGLDIIVNQNMKSAIQNRDREALMGIRKMTIEKLKPVRDQVLEEETKLNTAIETLLSEEQNKKWLSYQKFQKEKLQPKLKKPNSKARPNSSSGRPGGRRGGF